MVQCAKRELEEECGLCVEEEQVKAPTLLYASQIHFPQFSFCGLLRFVMQSDGMVDKVTGQVLPCGSTCTDNATVMTSGDVSKQ